MTRNCLKVIQVNLCKGTATTEAALQSAVELGVDILLIQEPRIIDDSGIIRSISHPNFIQIMPNTAKPRTIAYIAKDV